MYAGLKNGLTEHYRELLVAVAKATLEGNLIDRIEAIPNEICVEGKDTNLQPSVEKGLPFYPYWYILLSIH